MKQLIGNTLIINAVIAAIFFVSAASAQTVVCKQSDLSSQLTSMDGGVAGLAKLVNSTATLYGKAGGSKSYVKSVKAQAEALFLSAWDLTWSLNPNPLDCGATSLCASVSTTATTTAYLSESDALTALLTKVTKKLKSKGGKNVQIAKLIKTQGPSINKINKKTAQQVPTSESVCGAGVTVTTIPG